MSKLGISLHSIMHNMHLEELDATLLVETGWGLEEVVPTTSVSRKGQQVPQHTTLSQCMNMCLIVVAPAIKAIIRMVPAAPRHESKTLVRCAGRENSLCFEIPRSLQKRAPRKDQTTSLDLMHIYISIDIHPIIFRRDR